MSEPIAVEVGEQILWTGRPDPSAHFTRWDWFLIPFSIVWIGFVIVWLVDAVASGAPGIALAVGIFMALFGVYICVGRFAVKVHMKKASHYWLTSRRAIVRRGNSEDSIPLNPHGIRMKRSSRPDRVDVVFGRSYGPWAGMGMSRFLSPYANTGMDFMLYFPGAPFAFYDVRDGEALREALASAGIDLHDRALPAP